MANIPIDEQIAKFIIWTLYFVGLYFSLFWVTVLFSESNYNRSIKRSSWPKVTIIMPAWNEEKHVEWTIDSVYKLDYPKEKLKIIAVNDGSTDKTLEIMKKLKKEKYKDLIVIDKKNGGKHTAINEGLKITDSPYFVVLDVDCYVEPDALKRLIEEFDTKEVASVMPIMKVANPKNVLQRVQWLEYIMNIFYKYIMGKMDCIHVVPGPFSAYRTSYVKELGYFRKAHKTEDLEMALRLQDKHYKLKQSLRAIVYTASPATLKQFVSQRTRWYQGTVLNVKDYKHFLFNRKYGDFGIFHIPLVGITGFLSLLGVLTLIYLAIKEAYHTIKRWYLTNFDFWTYITSYTWNTSLLDFDYQIMFTSAILFGLIFLIIYLSFIGNSERMTILRNIKYFFMFLYYFIIYRFIIAYVWFKVAYKLVFERETKGEGWEKVN